jgi:polar amino acid transport system substrate-binding protein
MTESCHIKKLKNVILGILLITFFPMPIQAETVLEKIKKNGVVKVAVREDAAPFGYLDTNKNLTGYCIDFIDLLKVRIKQELNLNILSIRLLKSTSSNRFDLIETRTAEKSEEPSAYLECGPNTIDANIPREITFSSPFFETRIQFLIRKTDEKKFTANNNLKGITIGVIGDTSSEAFIIKNYPEAEIEPYYGLTARTRGVQAVRQGKIDTFVSDGILLQAETELQNLSLENYLLVPEKNRTCDHYGMIIPKNDTQWQNLVNSVIQSENGEQVWQKWFGSIFNYAEVDEDVCKQ